MFCPIFWYLNWGVCHAAGTNSGTSTRLSNSLMEVYTSSSSQSFFYLHQRQHRKPPTSYLSLKTVKIVPALSCVLYILSLPISVSSSQAVSCWGRFGSEWVDLSRCCWVDYLAVTHPPARPRYWLRRTRDRNRGRNLCKSISCTDSVPSFGTCFHVFLLKKSIITKWRLLGNVSREMSDVPNPTAE